MPRILAVWDKAVLHVLDSLSRESTSQTWFTCARIKSYVYVPYCPMVMQCLNRFVDEGIVVRHSCSYNTAYEYTFAFNSSRTIANLRHNVKLYVSSESAVERARIQSAYDEVILAGDTKLQVSCEIVATPHSNSSVETVYGKRLVKRVKQMSSVGGF